MKFRFSMDTLRTCSGCGESKPIVSGFYVSNATKCRECVKAQVRANRLARIDHYRAFDRARAKLPHRVAARAEYAADTGRRYPETDPQKRGARVAVSNALRDGSVIRPERCDVCSNIADLHGHHDDYSRPLDVIWCCTPCHAMIHAYWRAQERRAA